MSGINEKYVVFDLETTGFGAEQNHIIEIGAVKLENGVLGETFSCFVACPQPLPERISALTGITDADLCGAPPVAEALTRFEAFARGSRLVAHALPFDFSFILEHGRRCGLDFSPFAAGVDTVAYARQVLGKRVQNCTLGTLADYFGVTFRHHRALSDALATAEIFLKLMAADAK